jgi:hypothetical protein
MADADAKNAPQPPPNLRVANSEDRECGNCQHYQRGRCELPILKNFVLPVNDEWVCDDWKAGGTDADDGPMPGSNLKDAERNAFISVRAHQRAKASPQQ